MLNRTYALSALALLAGAARADVGLGTAGPLPVKPAAISAYGAVQLRIVDQNGGPLPNALIVISSLVPDLADWVGQSNGAGSFSILLPLPGTYRAQVLWNGQSATHEFASFTGQVNITMPTACYANCDNSSIAPVLSVNDFICFLNKFTAGDTYANCDGSETPPVLNVNDLICFLDRFAAPCGTRTITQATSVN